MARFTTLICDRCKASFDMRTIETSIRNPSPVRKATWEADMGAGNRKKGFEMDLCDPCIEVMSELMVTFRKFR
jgi:hypothetical protein